jgi:hypothetical protein
LSTLEHQAFSDFLRAHHSSTGADPVDLLMLDAEGAEFTILRAMAG